MQETIIARTVQKTLNQPEKTLKLTVNSQEHSVVATADTPLLYVLHDELHLTGPRFGCGLGQCGACTVHLDGKPIRSCITPVGSVVGHKITTLEGLAATYHSVIANASAATPDTTKLHPVQQAWIDEQVPQCGSCQNGWIMYSAHLLATVQKPTDSQIRAALSGLKCRCGSQVGILRAVRRAAKALEEA
jgi:aerobic-type carbon monoxide dehydrogenase small subunit (CoxS/CutS family)